MFEAVELVVVLNLKLKRPKFILEISERHDLAGVVGGKRGAPESLSQNLVAGTNALGVVCG